MSSSGLDPSAEPHPGRGLPTELFEQILDEVYDNQRDILTLQNCCLINHFFCSLSQRRLLRSVVIKLEPDARRISPSPSVLPAVCAADDFLKDLRRAPHLSQYIHVLTIVYDAYPYIRPDTDHWIAIDSSLLSLIPALTHLRSFRVERSRGSLKGADLSAPFITTRSLQGTIFDVMPPTLNEIALELEYVPFRYFQSCHWIKHISVLSLDNNIPTTPSSPIPRLQRLELGRIPPDLPLWLSLPGCPLDSGCIEVLALAPRTMFDMMLDQNLGPCMKSVNQIQIDSSHFGDAAFAKYNTLNYVLSTAILPLPDLQSFDSLTTLAFSASCFARTFQRHVLIDYFTNPLVWIVDLISSHPPNRLRKLILNFTFVSSESSYAFPDEVVRLLRRDWAALRTILRKKQPSTKLAISLHGLNHAAAKIVSDDLTSLDFTWDLITKSIRHPI